LSYLRHPARPVTAPAKRRLHLQSVRQAGGAFAREPEACAGQEISKRSGLLPRADALDLDRVVVLPVVLALEGLPATRSGNARATRRHCSGMPSTVRVCLLVFARTRQNVCLLPRSRPAPAPPRPAAACVSQSKTHIK
jgi:hypothetical protein